MTGQTSNLIHLIYSSAAATNFTEAEVTSVLAAARSKNSVHDVSGMLLFVDGSFLQVLEGPTNAVDAIFETISSDSRHSQIVTIIRETIARRDFSDWSMGYAKATPRELAEISGLNDFFDGAGCLNRLTHGRTKKLLTAFKAGRWRSRLSAPQRACTGQPHRGPLGSARWADLSVCIPANYQRRFRRDHQPRSSSGQRHRGSPRSAARCVGGISHRGLPPRWSTAAEQWAEPQCRYA